MIVTIVHEETVKIRFYRSKASWDLNRLAQIELEIAQSCGWATFDRTPEIVTISRHLRALNGSFLNDFTPNEIRRIVLILARYGIEPVVSDDVVQYMKS